MDSVILISLGLSLVRLASGLLTIYIVLRILDKLGAVNFQKLITGVQNDSKAAAIYFGLRFFGACVFAGLILS